MYLYRFRCLDVDGDGILSAYELNKFWQDQDTKYVFFSFFHTIKMCRTNFFLFCNRQNFFGNPQVDGTIQFEDIIRQM